MIKHIFTLLLVLALTVPAFAADGDILQTRVRKDVNHSQLDTVTFHMITGSCKVLYREVDDTGIPVGEWDELLIDNPDDPLTVENEESTEFTDLMTALKDFSKIVTTAVETKLGI